MQRYGNGRCHETSTKQTR